MGLFSRSKSKDVRVAGPQATGSGSARRDGAGEQQAVAGVELSSLPSRPRSPYTHRRLQQGEIRLFVLHRGRPEEPIQVTIEHHSVSSRPQYTALSFMWGDTSIRSEIFVDKRPFTITHSLSQALKGIRPTDRDILMWADQISIDQTHREEKNKQVGHMAVIYPRASGVICWLGLDDGFVEQAFAVLRRWAAASGEGIDKEKMRAELVRMTSTSSDLSAEEAMTRLFTRPWWRRAWTLQEVLPSQTNRPVLRSGQHELSWSTFYRGCYSMLSSLRWSDRSHPSSATVLYILPMLRLSWADNHLLQLSTLVPIVARREATDPRDKIFALLGITAAAGFKYPAADYSLTADQVCMKYTRAMIEVDGSLDILFSVPGQQAKSSLPSWCVKIDQLLSETAQLDGYNATLRSRPTLLAPRSEFDPVLQLEGLPLDTIERQSSVESVVAELARGDCAWDEMLARTASFCSRQRLPTRYAATGSSIATALLNTLTVANFYIVSSTRASYEQRQPAWDLLFYAYQLQVSSRHKRFGSHAPTMSLQSFMTTVQRMFKFESSSSSGRERPPRQLNDKVTKAWLDRRVVTDFLGVVKSTCENRCLFVTRRGFLGLGPLSAQPGDQVCLLFGASTPLLLRGQRGNNGGVFQLLDEVYCEGMMQGQALGQYVVDGSLRTPKGGWTRYALV